MEFAFGTVERVLARGHYVRDDARPAFVARLKHLQRLNFPPGINTGRGRAARYGVGHLVLLAAALELIQLGVPPERARDYVIRNTEGLAKVVHLIRLQWADEETPNYALGFVPSNLAALMGAHYQQIEGILMIGLLRDFANNMAADGPGQFIRFCYTNLTRLVGWLTSYLADELRISSTTALGAIGDWAVAAIAEHHYDDDPQA